MDIIDKFNTKKMRVSLYITLIMFSIFLLSACSPLSVIVQLPYGPYDVNIHGVTTSLDPSGDPALDAPDLDERSLIPVEAVEVRVGQGSPIPVDIVISGTWPDLCAQITEVNSSVEDFQIDVTILASTSSPCPPDQLGLPFLFELPLNTVEMPEGVYSISVNGYTGPTLELPLKP